MTIDPFDFAKFRRAVAGVERRAERLVAAEAKKHDRDGTAVLRQGLVALRAEADAGDDGAAATLRAMGVEALEKEVGRVRRVLPTVAGRDAAFAAASLRATGRRIEALRPTAKAARDIDEADRSRRDRDAVALVEAWERAGAEDLLESLARRAAEHDGDHE